MIRNLLAGLALLIAILVAAGAILVASRQNLRFPQTSYPAVHASTDSAVIERGHYIVRTLAGCGGCHGDATRDADFMAGQEVPMSGGYVWDVPPGKFHTPNITPDTTTGIGRHSDEAIARALRYGVAPDGRALLPFMSKQGLSDDDLVAVVSYLRTQPPVANRVPAHQYSLLGKIVKATVLANPAGPNSPPPPTSPRGATVENGRYLVESVIGCGDCHTQRDQKTGVLVGAKLGGATGLEDEHNARRTWSPPNVTTGGMLGQLDEDAFVARFHAGPLYPGTPMPWVDFARIQENDVRAIYRYLMTVPAVSTPAHPPFEDKK